MIGSNVLTKVFGTSNERVVKRLLPRVAEINALEPGIQALSDEQLRAKTVEFRARIAAALEGITEEEARVAAEKQALDDLLPEAFAVVREAGWRAVHMRHFDVQLVGGMVLHQGKIAEMKTGEGKTLVATLPCYLNALAGHGVHVVTVNDYLAKRDAEWMGKIYEFLGLTVGVIVHDLDDQQRRKAYGSDITYGTNNEFGFDYLRDNMKFELADCVQRGHYFSIVDEVDSILIDEARTPLIISGPTDQTTDKYARVNRIIPSLEEGEEIIKSPEEKYLTGDFVVDEKHKTITVTDEGWEKIEGLLGIGNIADPENWDLKHHVETAIKAHSLYKKDVQYVVKDGEVIIVDEFTGRLMPGRRWSDGLHQAVEAKEGVNIRREDQTLATITFQNYFRLYKKLAGMTGTAETEAAEFDKIYKLDIVVIPTNKPMRRLENADVVFRTAKEKYHAVADEIAKLHENQQPVLVGTTSIEKSELLSQILARKGVRHVVLNAKYHEREAEIVAQAGRLGMVTSNAEPGWCRPEPARVLVEAREFRLVVDVNPFTAGLERLIGHRAHQVPPDAEAPEVRVHCGVQDERVDPAVPDGVREADQPARAERAGPGQAMALQPGCPRAGSDVRTWAVRAERPVVQRGQHAIVDRELNPQLDCHHVNLPMLARTSPPRTQLQTAAVTTSLLQQ